MPSERAQAAGSASQSSPSRPDAPAETLVAVACVSAALLMTELALTRIFSVVMYYHFAFLAISIALFGLSASGVFAFVRRRHFAREETGPLLGTQSLVYAACTVVSLFVLVRLRVGLNYSPRNLALMLTIYTLAALPFFTGGLVVSLAISRLSSRINAVYAADLLGAAAGCLVLLPLLDRVGAPGVVVGAAALAVAAAAPLRAAGTPGARDRDRRGDPRCSARGPVVRHRPVRHRGHQGPRGRSSALQQVEFVLAHRRLRACPRRLVAQPGLYGTTSGDAIHGHRLVGVHAHPPRLARPVQCPIPALRADGPRLLPQGSFGAGGGEPGVGAPAGSRRS